VLDTLRRVPRVLVTGFEPFGGDSLNPASELLARLDGVATERIPVVYGAAIDALRDAVARHDPEVVVALGLAKGRAEVTVERVALNLDENESQDNAGAVHAAEPILEDAPFAYPSTLPVREIVERLRAEGIPAGVSRDAGGFVCNHAFFGLMHLLATERPGTIGGFVHIPALPEQVVASGEPSMALETTLRAVELVVETATAAR
jgi:pyroglutamyl-peptidase